MDTILTVIKQIAAGMLVLSFLLSILPDGTYKPVIRTIGSLMILLSCMECIPVIKNFAQNVGMAFEQYLSKQDLSTFENALAASNTTYTESVLASYEAQIQTKLEERLQEEQYTVENVSLTWEEATASLLLNVTLKSTNGIAAMSKEYSSANTREEAVLLDLKTYISGFYPIYASNINITVQE
jgi:hypothetical protein